jgi:TrbM
MDAKKIISVAALLASQGVVAQPTPQVLEGDERMACEAILCLAASTRPAQCMPSIQKYFSISFRWFSDTLRGRANFLNLCPTGNAPGMAALKQALVNGAGRCDAPSLNASNWAGDEQGGGMVMNNIPEYCSVLAGNAYVAAGAMPRYVGTPERGGYWVESKDYDAAFKAYTEKLNKAAEDAASNQTMN